MIMSGIVIPLSTSIFLDPVSEIEISNIIGRLRNNKAPGHDNIGPRILKTISSVIAKPLAHTFNLSFSCGKVPSALKLAKFYPLFKKVKEVRM